MKRVFCSFALLLVILLQTAGCNGGNSLTQNPSVYDVKNALKQINTIMDINIIEDVSSDLSIGYVGGLYFSDINVPEADKTESTYDWDNGGGIEFFAKKSDAKKRGEFLFYGSNTRVVGTLIIHTSSKLNASQQQMLLQQIENALTGKQ
jgi:hypothetical protein